MSTNIIYPSFHRFNSFDIGFCLRIYIVTDVLNIVRLPLLDDVHHSPCSQGTSTRGHSYEFCWPYCILRFHPLNVSYVPVSRSEKIETSPRLWESIWTIWTNMILTNYKCRLFVIAPRRIFFWILSHRSLSLKYQMTEAWLDENRPGSK